MEKIALVTVTYNAEHNLSFFLPSLLENAEVLGKVYIVDNHSTDTTVKLLNVWRDTHQLPYQVAIQLYRKNYGYTYAVNEGIRRALADGYNHILVTNNDIIFQAHAFGTLLRDASKNHIDALGIPASINVSELGLGYTIDTSTLLPKKGAPLLRANLPAMIKENPLPQVDFPHGGTILFSKKFFDAIGLYDHHLFFGGDELDFMYRTHAYNRVHEKKILCASSLSSLSLVDNLSKHNTAHRLRKAAGMLAGNARVNLKHRFSPMDSGLYQEQKKLIEALAKGKFVRYIALYIFAIRGLILEIYRYYCTR